MKRKTDLRNPDSRVNGGLHPFSPRELEVLHWLKSGKTSWEMSGILEISERTVNYHVNNIMQKLNAINRLQAVSEASRFELSWTE